MSRPSRKRLRERQCGNKVRHYTLAAAQELADLLNGMEQARKGYNIAQKLQAYHCFFCNFFHIGHTPRRMLEKRGVIPGVNFRREGKNSKAS